MQTQTLVALERLLPSVRSHVALQKIRRGASVVALVTLMWLFSCMVTHHVLLQITCCNTGILTHCASVRLFTRVGPFVHLQMAWIDCSIVALVALIWFRSGVFLNVISKRGNLIGWIVALGAPMWFFSSVNEEVGLQTSILDKWLVALWTIVPIVSTVGLPVIVKTLSACKCLGT